MSYLNIGLAQINPKVGDLEGNFEKILSTLKSLRHHAHLVVFPELSLSGYPPKDLLLRRDFLRDCVKYLEKLKEASREIPSPFIVGLPLWQEVLYNSAILFHQGEIKGIYHKEHLPQYGVFDEKRYFAKGKESLLFDINGVKIGVTLCEDIWYPSGPERAYVLSGAHIILSLNASPYTYEKFTFKENFLKARAQDNQCYVVYVNLVGAQDDLVFDGRSLIIDPHGKVLAQAKAFEEDFLIVSLPLSKVENSRLLEPRLKEESFSDILPTAEIKLLNPYPYYEGKIEENPKEEAEIYLAIKLALRDYCHKNNFKGAILGLSGGIDSALTLVLAVDALGKEKVKALFMPSKFTSKESYEDAQALAKNLGIELLEISIDPIFDTYLEELRKGLPYKDFTVAEENLQARIRANLLFYVSNREGYLVLATSNKSEAATGYGTIYGDMAGGFAPLKDVYKTWVYRLARYRNSLSPVIPERIFRKAPSAELRPGQTDQDTLPPYGLLDEILRLHLEEGLTPEEIVERGLAPEMVMRILKMLKNSEFKRQQTPPGPKITKRTLGSDYKMPITCGYV